MFLSFECGKNVLAARFHSTMFCVSVMEGVWSSPFEFPTVPDDEELDGDMSLMGTGGLSGQSADGDTRMFGSGRSSGYGYDYGDMNEDGLNQAITPFAGGAMQGGLGSGGPISLIGNTRRVGHRDDLSKVMSPNGICRVCEYVVSGFHYSVQPCCTSRLQYAVWHECRGVSSLYWRKKSTN